MIVNSKRGEVSDMLIWLITIFILAVGLFIIIYVVPSISGGLRTAGLNDSTAGANAIDSMEDMASGVFNYGFLILFVGLVISLMISSFLIRTHPIFMFLYILFLGITLFVGLYLGNAYDTLKNNAIFSSVVENASFINLVMGHIVEITLAVGALSMIIIFAKFSTFGGTEQQF